MRFREHLGFDPVEEGSRSHKRLWVEEEWLRLNTVLKGALWGLQRGQTMRDQGLTQGTRRSQRR